jgi:hypothetical protein
MKFKNLFILSVLVLMLLPVFSHTQNDLNKETYSYNLDGVFSGGGGNYYIRQLGNEILWYGEEDAVSPTWSNVAHALLKVTLLL